MKATVDATKCSGYGRCVDLCPEVFELDEWGYAAVAGDGSVPDGAQERARAAAHECPEQAITVQD